MKIGDIYEHKAIIFLKNQGFKIIKHNARYKKSQIDIICEKNHEIYAVEVKYRYNQQFLTISSNQLKLIEDYMLINFPGQFFHTIILFFNNNHFEIKYIL